MRRLRINCGELLLSIAILAAGCGSNPGKTQPNVPPKTPPFIAIQPASVTEPLDQSATFKVDALGSLPLTYQWKEDGVAIAGAAGASYQTAPVAASNNGEEFAVTVSNSVGSVTSQSVELSVGPRSPLPGDLRFQQVDAPSWQDGALGGVFSGTSFLETATYPNAVGSPIELGYGVCVPGVQYDCAWRYVASAVPPNVTGQSVTFQSGAYSSFDNDIGAVPASNSVIDCLDLEPANDSYAMSWITSTYASGFQMYHFVVSPSDLQSAASQQGAESRVVTAVSYDDSTGKVQFLDYSWTGDPSTVYDVSVQTASYGTIGAVAENLAQAGYIITALGGNNADGFILVGTKVKGDTIPRPILVEPPYIPSSDLSGWAPLGFISQPHTSETIWIDEK